MNNTGKQSRKQTGLNRYGCHRVNHARKSPDKVRRAGWTRTSDKRQPK